MNFHHLENSNLSPIKRKKVSVEEGWQCSSQKKDDIVMNFVIWTAEENKKKTPYGGKKRWKINSSMYVIWLWLTILIHQEKSKIPFICILLLRF